MSALLALAAVIGVSVPAAAAERTILFSPADLAVVIDDFNASLIKYSTLFGRTLAVRGGIVKLAKKGCPSLAADPLRRLTRVRVLDSAERAALFGGGRTGNTALRTALVTMGATTWQSPASGRVDLPTWLVEPATPGVVGFATVGHANGNGVGAVDYASRGVTDASLLVHVDVPSFTTDPFEIVLALTVDVPPRRATGAWKRTECFVLAPRKAADAQALVDLVAAAPLADVTRNRLNNILIDVLHWVAEGDAERTARNLRIFSVEVASRSGGEIPVEAAEELLTRALTVTEAQGF